MKAKVSIYNFSKFDKYEDFNTRDFLTKNTQNYLGDLVNRVSILTVNRVYEYLGGVVQTRFGYTHGWTKSNPPVLYLEDEYIVFDNLVILSSNDFVDVEETIIN